MDKFLNPEEFNIDELFKRKIFDSYLSTSV